MKSLMLKLLIISISISLYASEDVSKILNFLNSSIQGTSSYVVKNIKIYASTPLEEAKGWSAYFVKIDVNVPAQNKDIVLRDVVFSNGVIVSKKMNDLTSGKDMKNLVSPYVDPILYDESHLIAGDFKAPNKLLVFSEPLCPFCMDFVPDLLKFVQKNSKQFALFYYHKPLTSLHPSALGLIKAMEAAKKKGMKDSLLRTYEEVFSLKTSDENEIVQAFNKVFNQNITVEEMNSEEIITHIKKDIEISKIMMVNGTPTLFVNGKRDNTRSLYTKLKDVK